MPPRVAVAEREAALQAVFEALAHPSRRHILLVLRFRGGRMTAGQIAERFACTWPTTTRHLKVLEQAGLVSVARRGRERVYRLEARRLRVLTGGFLRWFKAAASPAEPGVRPGRAGSRGLPLG